MKGRQKKGRRREKGKRNFLTRLVLARFGKCCLQKVRDCSIHHLLPALGERWGGMSKGEVKRREGGKEGRRDEGWRKITYSVSEF